MNWNFFNLFYLCKKLFPLFDLRRPHPKITLLTLLVFSSSNTGFLGRGEDDGIIVASRGTSGSAKTMAKRNMTDGYYTAEVTVSKGNTFKVDRSALYCWMSLACKRVVLLCIKSNPRILSAFTWLVSHPVTSASHTLQRLLLHPAETQSSCTASRSLLSSLPRTLCPRDTEKVTHAPFGITPQTPNCRKCIPIRGTSYVTYFGWNHLN